MSPLSFVKSFIIYTTIFLFPLFFLPITQEFFVTNKLYFLAFISLILFLISTIELLITKKIVWDKIPIDAAVLLFFIAVGLSVLFSSPNKIQALLNPNFGLVSIASVTIFYFYISRTRLSPSVVKNSLYILSLIFSVLTLIFFFGFLNDLELPTFLQFLRNSNFSLIGSHLDLVIYTGFFTLLGILEVGTKKLREGTDSVKLVVVLTLSLLAFCLALYTIFQPQSFITLPPFSLSWHAAVETLKNPVRALFGTGIDNYSSIFTQIKNTSYNHSRLWQITSFSVARSTVLHILTETGILGLLAFSTLFITIIRRIWDGHEDRNKNILLIISSYFLIIFILFPPSLPLFFLAFTTIGFITNYLHRKDRHSSKTILLSSLIPAYLGLLLINFISIGGAGYSLIRSYAAEFAFKQSLNGFAKNNVKEVYDNQRQAIILNPYIERFRIAFSQTNLVIADNIARKTTPKKSNTQPSNDLNEQERQTIAQAIQASIAEAKTVVTLNPYKANYWENLGLIYRNILNVAQGADSWAIAAYQRAIVLDPQNPAYRLHLGGVFYSLGNYEEATRLFEQAIGTKPDWPNAYYNLAWAYYQKGDYQRAVLAMQNSLSLLNEVKDENDYKKGQKELEVFKKKIPQVAGEKTPSSETQDKKLSLPTPPIATVEPKIKLSQESLPSLYITPSLSPSATPLLLPKREEPKETTHEAE